ncbi:MAG: hypothetical protein IT285_05050 [Bdellovibrionales bacterium]|nr:hypothetical protein [Bdellovibrionales bacterium]
MSRTPLLGLFSVFAAAALLGPGCSPAPRRTLSSEEKLADLRWVYSQFGENYAPLDLKQQTHGFEYEELKRQTDELALATSSNTAFYEVVYGFVARFKDAHTVASLAPSGLPGREFIAHLGISGVRKGSRLVVRDILPRKGTGSLFPLQKGDEILELDGVGLKERALEFRRYWDLGNEEANLTYHMPRLFERLSLENGQPEKADAVLKVKRGDRTWTLTLPWVVRDLSEYQVELAQAAQEAPEDESEEEDDEAAVKGRDRVSVRGPGGELEYRLGLVDANGAELSPSLLARRAMRGPGFRFWDSFMLLKRSMRWKVIGEEGERAEGDVALKGMRELPEFALPIAAAKTFPAYIVNIALEADEDDEDEKRAAPRLAAYLLLDSFSPSEEEDAVVKEFKATLKVLQAMGVKDLVIDLINNGGGSLLLGMRLAQALSKEAVQMPTMRFAVNEGWVDDFERLSLTAPSDPEKELYRRVFRRLLADAQAGKRLSDPFPAESLQPFLLDPNLELDGKFNVTLLVNEMCASMCDIFSGILQDNGLATVLGARTMGAGGNVVMHLEAPNAHFVLNQTESLVFRKDGTPVENNGVTPEVAVSVNEHVDALYTPVRDKAFKLILGDAGTRRALRFLSVR